MHKNKLNRTIAMLCNIKNIAKAFFIFQYAGNEIVVRLRKKIQ
jgi:hypothetical protein